MTVQLGATLFKIAFWAYLISAVGYVLSLINRKQIAVALGRAFLAAALGLHTASLVVVTAAIGRPPFLNLYEYMLCFTWAAAVVYLVLEISTRNRAFGGFAVPLVAAFAYLTSRLPADLSSEIVPALRSAWRIPHIASGILAYAAFGLAFVLAIMYLIREGAEGKEKSFWASRLPALKVLDQATYRTIAFGFLMQTLLVIVGAIWAQYAWGRYWGWDPKETWALITWLVYAAYLHTRATMGWRGRKSAIVAIIGFLATAFTLFGVSLLLPGLHSYS